MRAKWSHRRCRGEPPLASAPFGGKRTTGKPVCGTSHRHTPGKGARHVVMGMHGREARNGMQHRRRREQALPTAGSGAVARGSRNAPCLFAGWSGKAPKDFPAMPAAHCAARKCRTAEPAGQAAARPRTTIILPGRKGTPEETQAVHNNCILIVVHRKFTLFRRQTSDRTHMRTGRHSLALARTLNILPDIEACYFYSAQAHASFMQ